MSFTKKRKIPQKDDNNNDNNNDNDNNDSDIKKYDDILMFKMEEMMAQIDYLNKQILSLKSDTIERLDQKCTIYIASRNIEWSTYYHKWYTGKISDFIIIQFQPNKDISLIELIINSDAILRGYLIISDEMLIKLRNNNILNGSMPYLLPPETGYTDKIISCISICDYEPDTSKWCSENSVTHYQYSNIPIGKNLDKHYIIINQIGKI
jgi:hypothetical protein